ncbi:DUF11 domain-containing protein [Botrimarina hoheduenensis]|uniref:Large cysteine-rich periplasmic protein OmcB n=1 Tax=Botrimarina hoheduenensis TaxID=2528000 RepID=A0A5C5VSN1_9BACT|nr:DUF11 domain-containing protein [Botrimarina hoheduenensis]TWT41638.1 Large cysteine-rich periplasmic protein OmcB precursor [Botrimarina hoheduenensis]
MIRLRLFVLATLLSVSFSPYAVAQESPDSLADRLRALRKGWSFASDQSSSEAATRPAPQAKPANDAGDVPRVDPREVLPRRWFGEGVSAPVNARGSAQGAEVFPPAVATDGTAVDGSARSRMLRDLRAQPAGTAPQVLGRSLLGVPATRRPVVVTTDRTNASAPVRAGSVLSGDDVAASPAGIATAQGPGSSSASAALARSIAADVARSMADDPFPPTNDQQQDSYSIVPPITQSTTGSVADATSSTSKGSAESVRVAMNTSKAGSDDIQIKLSDSMPLFIGERYDRGQTEAKIAASSIPAARTRVATAPTASADSAVGDSAVGDDRWLLTQAAPMLVSRVQGPRTITVGREATYRVVLANRGDATADQVIVKITVPAGAELVGSVAKQGRVTRSAEADDSQVLLWKLDRLVDKSTESIELRLIARTGKPIDLGVACEHRPIDGATTVNVQEPLLKMQLEGPDDVLFGKPQTYRLTLSNPGTGVAEDVVLRLTPPGSRARTTTHNLGSLAAGASRSVEVELVAREPGPLRITADATAAGSLTAAAEREILCRKAELVVDWRGPDERYAGAPALYYFRVRNPGNAEAPGVELTVDLPHGFRVLNAGEGRTTNGRRLTYAVGALDAGEDRYFELRGVFEAEGTNELVLHAEGSDATQSENASAITEVVALADLKLDILDPKGPIATGQEIEYEIRVTNRGANAARDVRVIGMFSEGIDPLTADGAMCQIQDGRVAFDTIATLAAGAEQVFKIRAKAKLEGTHLFRAEVLCRDLEIKLAAEEATRFFQDETLDVASDGYGPYYPR